MRCYTFLTEENFFIVNSHDVKLGCFVIVGLNTKIYEVVMGAEVTRKVGDDLLYV